MLWPRAQAQNLHRISAGDVQWHAIKACLTSSSSARLGDVAPLALERQRDFDKEYGAWGQAIWTLLPAAIAYSPPAGWSSRYPEVSAPAVIAGDEAEAERTADRASSDDGDDDGDDDDDDDDGDGDGEGDGDDVGEDEDDAGDDEEDVDAAGSGEQASPSGVAGSAQGGQTPQQQQQPQQQPEQPAALE